MPDRVIREGIIESERVNNLTFGAEVFYRRLLNKADDYGCYLGTPKLLRGKLFAMQLHRVFDSHVEKWLTEVVAQKLVAIYEVEGKPYVYIFRYGQRLRQKRRKFPEPPESLLKEEALSPELDSELQQLSDRRQTHVPHARAESESESESE